MHPAPARRGAGATAHKKQGVRSATVIHRKMRGIFRCRHASDMHPNRMRGAQQHLSSYRTPLRRRRGRGTFGFCRSRGTFGFGGMQRRGCDRRGRAGSCGCDGISRADDARKNLESQTASTAAGILRGGRGKLGRRAMRIRAVWTIKENRTIPSIRTTRGYCATAEYLQDPILWKATADP